MPNDPIQRLPQREIDRLRAIDLAYRGGDTQDTIAAAQKVPVTSEALRNWMRRRGWRFRSDHQGNRVVNTQDGTSLKGWLDRLELAPTEEHANVSH